MELFWNSLDTAPSSIVFYLEMKVEEEVGVHDITSRFTPRLYVYVYVHQAEDNLMIDFSLFMYILRVEILLKSHIIN